MGVGEDVLDEQVRLAAVLWGDRAGVKGQTSPQRFLLRLTSCWAGWRLTFRKRLTFPSLLASRKLTSSTFIALFKLFWFFGSVPFTAWTSFP